MLPKHERVNRNDQIVALIRTGRKIDTSALRISVKRSASKAFSGTVICAKSVDKRASKRNLLKRRSRELLRTILKKTFPDSEVLVTVKPKAKDQTLSQMRADLIHALHI